MTSFEKRRAAFGERLRQLRESAGLNGKELATAVGWNAPKVSKIEKGRQTASGDDLEAWIAALRVDAATADQLRSELSALNEAYASWKEKLRAGQRARQEESLERESRARLIRAVDVGVVPGLLQTAEYAKHVLLAVASLHGGGQDVSEAVRTRMRRQQVLYEPDKTVEILLTEAALLHPIAPPEVMVGQIHRLVATIGTPNIRFGILPAGERLPYPLTHGFWIVDDLAMVETVTGELMVTDPDELATLNQLTDMLWSVAVEGDRARDLLLKVMN